MSTPASPRRQIMDGNEAAARVAYKASEVIAIYPITPASPMGELSDQWATAGLENLWGQVPEVVEMQSEGGAAGAVHGALQTGSLATSFTASQGLLLMIPNLYKIAGELTPFVLHVAARAVATHALSIFGDHSDVMAVRQTGCAMLASASVQEAQDMAAVAHAATLASRIPFIHFFDGFRTSHELNEVAPLDDDTLRRLLDPQAIAAHRQRALTPDAPVIRGTAQNPDVFFQAREAVNSYYESCVDAVEAAFDQFAELTGRRYRAFEYSGDERAERVVVIMGSAGAAARHAAAALNARGERVGVLQVRLYRPFSARWLIDALPSTVRAIAVLDRTKEPGGVGEPLYLDVMAALAGREVEDGRDGGRVPSVVGGRYGLGGKEVTPETVAAAFAELTARRPRHGFTLGIVDDVTGRSLPAVEELAIDRPESFSAVFYGLGSDGTVSANKSTLKILGGEPGSHVQGFFVYDSKKAGAVTVSHLRVGPRPIDAPYLVREADFVACHQFQFLDRMDVLESARPGATLLLNAPYPADEVWEQLAREVQEEVLAKKLAVWTVDASAVARECGLGSRINTVMQSCFFAVTGLLEREAARAAMRRSVSAVYGRRGEVVVERNQRAIDLALGGLERVEVPAVAAAERRRPPLVPAAAPDFVQRVTALLLAGKGDALPVSALPVDGTWPLGTTRWEKRGIAAEIPIWDPEICIQCNQCVLACPHAAIRSKVAEPLALADAPAGFRSTPYRAPDMAGRAYSLQVAPDDCTGCRLCFEVCPAKDRTNPRRKALAMEASPPHLELERRSYDYFLGLPEIDRQNIPRLDAKGSQFLQPLFEYSGACAGCGETPYVKLLTQLFGNRLLVANATGCSSIYGGNLPTTPFCTDAAGRGPAWSNSLFEDNAEFGLGFRLAVDSRRERASILLETVEERVGKTLAAELRANALERDEDEIVRQRGRVVELRRRLAELEGEGVEELARAADALVPKSVWMVGGDGWAYDIGYGGLDHVLALGRDVNVLVLDTEVYSNTGGQQSKATPLGAAAKFASAGKETPKKDLGLEIMSYGHVYVARIAFGAQMNQTVQALLEADAYPGPSLVIAYSHCVAHGYDMAHGAQQQKLAVDAGIWPLYRFDPRRRGSAEPPLVLDSKAPRLPVERYFENEARFRVVERQDRARYRRFVAESQRQARQRHAVYSQLAGLTVPSGEAGETPAGGE